MKKEREQQTAKRCLITISIPVYNEEDNIKLLLDRLCRLAEKELQYEFEFLFTDNASTDRTFELIAEQAANDKRIRVLRFSRNFGFQKSILTNYRNARGDAAVQIDADLQDPPELISEFLRKWEEGYKVVYGVRRRRKESAFLAFSRKLYYSLIDNITSYPVPRNAGDFRLVDKIDADCLKHVRLRAVPNSHLCHDRNGHGSVRKLPAGSGASRTGRGSCGSRKVLRRGFDADVLRQRRNAKGRAQPRTVQRDHRSVGR